MTPVDVHTQQLGKLAGHDDEADPSLVAGQHRIGNEVREESKP